MEQHQLQALLASATSILSKYREGRYGHKFTAARRAEVMGELETLAMEEDDLTDWEHVRHQYMYDDYLVMRTNNETISDYDLIRPGLLRVEFNSEAEWFKHCARLSETRKIAPGSEARFGFKFCSVCDQELPLSKFKKRGGSKCSACRSRQYRERVKERDG